MKETKTIVVTGGDLSGKTSGLELLPKRIAIETGYHVITIPEVATRLFASGVPIGEDGLSSLDFQRHALAATLTDYNRYRKLAEDLPNPKMLNMFDRGTMDGAGFLPWLQFQALLESEGHSVVGMRDVLYDAVMHLDTAPRAVYEEKWASNEQRVKRTWGEVWALNERIKRHWVGHPHLRIIDNSTDFSGKMERLYTEILHVLGFPVPHEIERKFLVQPLDILSLVPTYDLMLADIAVEQVYLTDLDGFQRRVRQRGQYGSFAYYETRKQRVTARTRIEKENKISPLEYYDLTTNHADPGRVLIRKTRFCFLWNGHYFELDLFHEPEWVRGLMLLEVELTHENEPFKIPPFISVIREVTEEEAYGNTALALKRTTPH